MVATYTRTAIVLHWLVAALVLTNIALILSVPLWPDGAVRPVINTHKSIGITVLGLALMRWLWRATHSPPPLPATYARWERVVSRVVHWAFYVLIVAIPLSGWIMDSAWKNAAQNPMALFGIIPWPRIGIVMSREPVLRERIHDEFASAHLWLGYTMAALFVIHVVGAFKHQFVDGDPQLQRMTRATKSVRY